MSAARALLLAALLAGCGARTSLRAPDDDVPSDAPSDAPVDAAVDAADASLGRPCGCPGTPSFRRCVLPLMCCPGLGVCADPAHFSCSGSSTLRCP